MEGLTAETLERAMLSVGAPVAATPTRMIVAPRMRSVLWLIDLALKEGWDRRRIKRELRRPETSTYRRKL